MKICQICGNKLSKRLSLNKETVADIAAQKECIVQVIRVI